ncbi:MAG TPA: GTPase Era [Bacteroidales bacterium]|nr:GTPase Era [Bacteroidales bacterium]HQH14372.1 GTPase Era [Bacteroidales bacterium]
MKHKAGFVSILGKPNVGKSTLMNALIGERLAVITNKAQTTRHRIKGILSGDDFQIVFSDTPGILKPYYKMHEAMMTQVDEAIEDADIVIYMIDPETRELDATLQQLTKKKLHKLIIAINKIDTCSQVETESLLLHWQQMLPQAEIIPISSLHQFNTKSVINTIVDNLPEHPAYYPKDELTDRTYRFFVSEIIRGKILNLYQKEVPYSVEVVVDEFKEEPEITRIRALIFVARESQRIILIGHKGNMIKKLGIEARKEIESFLQQKVYLELTVKVDKDWRDSEQALKRFGYII